jgi:hypothetical protein
VQLMYAVQGIDSVLVEQPALEQVAVLTNPTSDSKPSPDSLEARAFGPGMLIWLAPLASVGVGLLAVTLTPADMVRWSLLGLAAAALPMLPTCVALSMIRGSRPAFVIWQTAVAASLLRVLTSAVAVGAVLLLADAPIKPFVWVFLLVAGVGLAAEKLIVLGTARTRVHRRSAD